MSTSTNTLASSSSPPATMESHSPTSIAPLPSKYPTVSNIVCGINLQCRLDHRRISNSGRYHSNTGPARGRKGSRFPAAILRIKCPRATALAFDSGKMQVLGTRNVDDAKLAIRKFARILQKMGYQPRVDFAEGGFKVQNIVANVNTEIAIRLEGLAAEHYAFARYEPECFPGLSYQVHEPTKVTLLVFARGKVVFVGAKRVQDIMRTWGRMWPVLFRHRRT